MFKLLWDHTDVIIWEGDPADPMRKPPEMYTLIENFCLGTRRLELFGGARSSLRRGWLTVLTESDGAKVGEHARTTEGDAVYPWNKDAWDETTRHLASVAEGKRLTPCAQNGDRMWEEGMMAGIGMGGGMGMGNPGMRVGGPGMGMGMGNSRMGMGGMGMGQWGQGYDGFQ
ncbi:hypothetical protein DFH29DRAFT_1025540 [Suillus ampliporus]|nr:hypothetical protein DFH29DRAFT_1025540 [Suillus ampliporus]